MKISSMIRSAAIFLFLLLAGSLYAQAPAQLTVRTDHSPVEGEGFTIQATSSNPTVTFSKMTIGYRQPNDQYDQKEMQFQNGTWVFAVKSEFSIAPSLDYYIIATTSAGETQYYPNAGYKDAPAQITINPKKIDQNVAFLMGEPGQKMAVEDLMIMLSYYQISEVIDVASIKLTLNGKDITKEATVSADALTWIPEAAPAGGAQAFTFTAKLKNGTAVGPVSWTVQAVSAEEAEEEAQADENITFGGNSWYEFRYESIGGVDSASSTTNTINRFNTSLNGSYYWFGYSGNVYVTSEEDEKQQASNRYTMKLTTPYLDLGVGDVYPSFSRLIMNGSRVRGLEVNFKSDYINIDVATGYFNRAVDASFDAKVIEVDASDTDSINVLLGEDYFEVRRAGGKAYFQKRLDAGAFDKEVMAAKLSFGSKVDGFNTGLGFLLSKDDTTSNDFGELPTANLVVGYDAQYRKDNGRFELYGDVAMSVYNSDTKAQNPTLKEEIVNQLGQSTYDALNSFFPLSANIQAPASTEIGVIMNYFAIQTGLKLNYWNNYFKIEYIRNGASYRSDGLPFYQGDIQGLKLNDRLRLYDNKLFLNLGLDLLSDNLDGESKNYTDDNDNEYDGTTNRRTVRAGFAFFPGAKYPSLSFDYINAANKNELPDFATASTDFTSSTYIIGSNYSFSLANAFHTLGLSYSFTDKVDNRDKAIYLYRYGLGSYQQNSNSIITNYGTNIGDDISLNVSYNFASSTNIETVLSDSAQAGTINPGQSATFASEDEREITFNIIEASAFKSFFNNNVRVGARANMTFSDINQYIFGGSAQYNILPNLIAMSDLSMVLNEGVDNDLLFNFRLQFNY
ncbi:MAG: hypothetical protein HUU10_01945 [Bacteroidetes bacterium]|nr:hypothetical protein [Bacteroidota bacterium]